MKRKNIESFKKKYKNYKINSEIKSKKVRLVGEKIESKVYTLKKALKIAKKLALDLVEINPKATICKVMNFKKFLYKLKKKKLKKNLRLTKEIRLTSYTNSHDLSFKIEHAKKFLILKNKVKFSIFFKGRSIISKDLGEKMLLKCIDLLSTFIKVELPPRMDGKKMFIVLSPKQNTLKKT
ncbi:translation initiation factor IF-3 [Candidatus Karelsulcia muelleri]|uniref:translation initiation factor IF-3 n=1 Tax=Candidatus Karelsulcia muelleri TaxID=336810 RepID=UPI00308210B7